MYTMHTHTRRGIGLLRLIIIVAVISALLIFFDITSLTEIRNLFSELAGGVLNVGKTIWYQIIMPLVNFVLGILSRIVSR